MTSPITLAISSTLNAIKAIPYSWGVQAYGTADKVNASLLFQKVQLWNDQVSRMNNGTGFGFVAPACFLQMISGETTQLLENATTTDYTFRFHLLDIELDAGNGDFDQNLTVMTYRDILKSYMVGFQPDNCSTLFFINDDQDFTHTGVYHYIIDLKALFADTKGSILDDDQTKVIHKAPDTNLEIDLTIQN